MIALLAGHSTARASAERSVAEDPALAMGWVVLAILDRVAGRVPEAAEIRATTWW